MEERKLISAESVTEGHPDKLRDQIADAILDDMLRQDPHEKAVAQFLTKFDEDGDRASQI